MEYEVYGCCDKEFAGDAELAQARLLEHIRTVHADDPDLEPLSDDDHLQRARF